MKIYTKAGDKGQTSLFKGAKVSKSNKIFEVIGNLDELNSLLGLSASISKRKYFKNLIYSIQRDLFEMGSFLAGKKFTKKEERNWSIKIREFEKSIDKIDGKIPPIKNFILPGGTLLAANLHLTRTVCRRFERRFVEYIKSGSSSSGNKIFLVYINRLSDMLFVLARFANKQAKVKDIIWKSAP